MCLQNETRFLADYSEVKLLADYQVKLECWVTSYHSLRCEILVRGNDRAAI